MQKSNPSGPQPVATASAQAQGNEGVLREIRACLNQIVTSCEVLKMEPVPHRRALLARLDHIRSLAMALSGDLLLERAHRPALQEHETLARIVSVVQNINETIREIYGIPGIAHSRARDDLVSVEFAAHRLGQLASHFHSTAADNRGTQPPCEPQQGARPAEASGAAASTRQAVLVVDDDRDNREILVRFLQPELPGILIAKSGEEALAVVGREHVDLVLLDLVMPGMDGLAVLRHLRLNASYREIPVVIISSVDDMEKVVACLESGADDYVLKPFNATILRARVRGLLERKRLRDHERAHTQQLEAALRELGAQKQTAERLLLNILPQKTAEELRQRGSVSPTYFEDATIVFTDFVSFTSSTEKLAADDLVNELGYYFTTFDHIMDRYGLEKLKTVGDSYIFLAGVPERSCSHPVDAVLASFEMLECVKAREGHPLSGWAMRIGINTGPVIAGVVGTRKFAFDVWGDAVNFASRMVSSGATNRINISAKTYLRIKDFFQCRPRGEVRIKGNRWVEMYFLDGILPSLLAGPTVTPPPAFCERYSRYFQKELKAFPQISTGAAQP
jgi:adenylate cyclase